MLEVVTEWTTPAGGGHVSVMYFSGVTTAVVARQDVSDLFTAVADQLSDDVTWEVREECRVIDPITGSVTGFQSDPTILVGGGTTSASAVPDASQVLLRWRTDDVKNGRRVQGRTFVPGLNVNAVTDGNLNAGSAAVFNTAVQGMVTAGQLAVWSRPGPAGAGSEHEVTSGSVWSELAVLRGRRG